jgi:putative lipoprotein
MPAQAVFEAALEDVSKADAKAEVIGRTHIESPGNPPIAFEIAYDPARIDPRHRYAVRARIRAGDRLLFATDRAFPVLTAGAGNEVALTLRRVGGAGERSDEPLENTYWKLTELGGGPVVVAERQREPHFILHPAAKRVSGSGGCNRLTGSYDLEGDRLSFRQMAGTIMACAQGMETEKKFLAALQQASMAKIERQRLELLDAAGSVLARFEAVHLR